VTGAAHYTVHSVTRGKAAFRMDFGRFIGARRRLVAWLRRAIARIRQMHLDEDVVREVAKKLF